MQQAALAPDLCGLGTAVTFSFDRMLLTWYLTVPGPMR
jgi:hypothetical protein